MILANATVVEAAGRRDGLHLRLDGERIAEIADLALLGTDGPHLKAVIKGGSFAVNRLA